MSRIDPVNREQAFAYQFEDDVKVLHSMAVLDREAFRKHLAVMQAHIDAYNNMELQEQCDAARERSMQQKENLRKLGLE